MKSQTRALPPRLVVVAVALGAGLFVSACQKTGDGDVTGSIDKAMPASNSEASWRSYTEEWGKRYDAKPGDKQASINYARGLRALGQRSQAVAVLQAAVVKMPKDTELLAAYGKALAEDGQFKRAQEVLASAHSPDRPDWRILSAQGVSADQLGEHDQAQALYLSALKIKPDDPGILANLGLSYALNRQLPEAEATLRKAAAQPGADPRARQNLALVLGLEGKFGEAEQVAKQDMSDVDAAQSVASIRSMVSQTNSWSQIRSIDKKAAAQKAKAPMPAVGKAPMIAPAAPDGNG
jgi:Flp pilus assembly protein TadD